MSDFLVLGAGSLREAGRKRKEMISFWGRLSLGKVAGLTETRYGNSVKRE